MYEVYDTGFDLGKSILNLGLEEGHLLKGCIKWADYSSWKSNGWNAETIRKAELLFFYGCINANSTKLQKKEFMKMMFSEMFEGK